MLQHINRPRSPAARGGIDQNGAVIDIAKVVGEVHAADAVIGDRDAFRQLAFGQPLGDFHAEPVVAEEDVSSAADESAPGAGRHADPWPGSARSATIRSHSTW